MISSVTVSSASISQLAMHYSITLYGMRMWMDGDTMDRPSYFADDSDATHRCVSFWKCLVRRFVYDRFCAVSSNKNNNLKTNITIMCNRCHCRFVIPFLRGIFHRNVSDTNRVCSITIPRSKSISFLRSESIEQQVCVRREARHTN